MSQALKDGLRRPWVSCLFCRHGVKRLQHHLNRVHGDILGALPRAGRPLRMAETTSYAPDDFGWGKAFLFPGQVNLLNKRDHNA